MDLQVQHQVATRRPSDIDAILSWILSLDFVVFITYHFSSSR